MILTQKRAPVPMGYMTLFYGLLVLAVFLNISLWLSTHRMQPLWPNVPPAPSGTTAPFLGLGDHELAYRTLAYQLQLMGNESGQSTPLYRYDYNRLGTWFMTLHGLDPASDYVPYLASYYFGSTQDPRRQLAPVIDYLEVAGKAYGAGKWRWLSQAVYLAHYKRADKARAMDLAYELAALPAQMPHWARQMPAILSAADGDKETALRLMTSILQATLNDPLKKADPVEINFMVDFICHRLQSPQEAAKNALCTLPMIHP